MHKLTKIISGGQTGADRAALDAALKCNFPIGGYCPKGRSAEDGIIHEKYLLTEIEGGYEQRTLKNILSSDLTAIFYKSSISGGTEKTLFFCIENQKPYKLLDIEILGIDKAVSLLADAIYNFEVKILNVAGPRLSQCPEIYDFVESVFCNLLIRKFDTF